MSALTGAKVVDPNLSTNVTIDLQRKTNGKKKGAKQALPYLQKKSRRLQNSGPGSPAGFEKLFQVDIAVLRGANLRKMSAGSQKEGWRSRLPQCHCRLYFGRRDASLPADIGLRSCRLVDPLLPLGFTLLLLLLLLLLVLLILVPALGGLAPVLLSARAAQVRILRDGLWYIGVPVQAVSSDKVRRCGLWRG